ncbi:hypothetical protein [Psychrobacter piechaudii]|uniref:Uncharacterized protein n=1 Tax=Psychrobacter piechaudii TaxID=1945521 RepID=A0A1R4GSP7_9GAMM|nr:hypothetical protein [Psychrobacter piechaudii]SJM71226.1 hypothetical protein A1232T_01166 [Psychrobacter piechaudii]
MDLFFYVSFFLTQACLFEINDNFRSVSFAIKGNLLTVYFVLSRQSNDDEEAIYHEIMSLFDLWLSEFLEANNIEFEYELNQEVIYNHNKDFILSLPKNNDFVASVFQRKESEE